MVASPFYLGSRIMDDGVFVLVTRIRMEFCGTVARTLQDWPFRFCFSQTYDFITNILFSLS